VRARPQVHLMKHCEFRGPSVDVGIWFSPGDIADAFASDFPVPGHPFTLGDPTYYTVKSARLSKSIPTRQRGRSVGTACLSVESGVLLKSTWSAWGCKVEALLRISDLQVQALRAGRGPRVRLRLPALPDVGGSRLSMTPRPGRKRNNGRITRCLCADALRRSKMLSCTECDNDYLASAKLFGKYLQVCDVCVCVCVQKGTYY
jgi:hypothetical protein